jgi:hypothetical protein
MRARSPALPTVGPTKTRQGVGGASGYLARSRSYLIPPYAAPFWKLLPHFASVCVICRHSDGGDDLRVGGWLPVGWGMLTQKLGLRSSFWLAGGLILGRVFARMRGASVVMMSSGACQKPIVRDLSVACLVFRVRTNRSEQPPGRSDGTPRSGGAPITLAISNVSSLYRLCWRNGLLPVPDDRSPDSVRAIGPHCQQRVPCGFCP